MEQLKYSEILQQNKLLKGIVTGRPFVISVLSNVTVNSFKEIAEYSLRKNGINPVVSIGNYDNIIQDSSNCSDANMVIIFYDTLNIVDKIDVFFEDLPVEVLQEAEDRVRMEIDLIWTNLKDVPSVIFNKFAADVFPASYTRKTQLVQFVNRLNDYLEKTAPGNVTLIDLTALNVQIGVQQAYDLRFYNSSKAPYTLLFFKKYMEAIEPVLFRLTGKQKKALIFDCDNTLWKGIIGEDGMEKISMSPVSAQGRPYFEVQHIAKYLGKNGVIIGICSKNNMADVQEVIMGHSDMVLKNEDIVIQKVNWEDKATNLRNIAKELNIGIDSLVFVDDSPFEINLIKEQLPDITVIQVPVNGYEYPNLLLEYVYKYFSLETSEEDKKRTAIYKQQFQRGEESAKHQTLEGYLASLEIELDIRKDDRNQIPRIAQLTQKTNQFNLTTFRYTESQLQKFVEDENIHVFSVSVRDKFGDSGLTAVCIIKGDEAGEHAVIDSFLMSCRIIGRNIELFVMNHILRWLMEKGYKTVAASYLPTAKNQQVECFYEKLGFEPAASGNGSKSYILELQNYQEHNIEYIKIGSPVPTNKVKN